MRELGEYESGLCSGCGIHHEVASDPNVRVSFPPRDCDVCAGAAQNARINAEADKKHADSLGDNPPARRRDPSDGRYTMLQITRGPVGSTDPTPSA